ncbi:MAG TPA: hypothetical protein VJ301_12430 [Propionibacteriaceae bacterium]|nr:hypothetical protein [Propionibacteriaceae bacterium]
MDAALLADTGVVCVQSPLAHQYDPGLTWGYMESAAGSDGPFGTAVAPTQFGGPGMAWIEQRRRADGGLTVRVFWRPGAAREAPREWETFGAGSDAQNLARAWVKG